MPGITQAIGETNPKKGAVQFDIRRVDGVPFIIPSGAGVTTAPIGSVVTLQEFSSIGMKIVLGAAAYNDGTNTYSIIGVGFLEAASQTSAVINQTVGEYSSGDIAAMIIDLDAVAMVPMLASYNPVAGKTSYVTPAGLLTLTASGNVAFPGYVFFTTPGQQLSNQLKSGYCFARLTSLVI
jgi:hypothetical protein